jgi:hypothetical protein
MAATKHVMEILRAAGEPLTSRQIAARGEFENVTRVSCAVHELRRLGRVTTEVRDGERYHQAAEGNEAPPPRQPKASPPAKARPATAIDAAPLPSTLTASPDVLAALVNSATQAIDAYLASLEDPVLRHLMAARDAALAALTARKRPR